MMPFDKDGKWVRKPVYTKENHGNTSRKSISFLKSSNLVGISLVLLCIPLIAISSKLLNQSNGNIGAIVWRFQNEKFIKKRCSSHGSPGVKPKDCMSLLFKLGKESESITPSIHKTCKNLVKGSRSIEPYKRCVVTWKSNNDKRLKNQKAAIQRAKREREYELGRKQRTKSSSRNVTNQMDIQTKIMSNNAHRDYMNYIDSLQY